MAKSLLDFRRLQRFWFLIHYSAGLGGVVAGILAAAPRIEWWLWGVIAAVCTGLVTFLGPQQKGDSYKHAYFRLASAVARYESVETTTVEWLLDEYRNAQKIVLTGDVEPLAKGTPATV